jgi:predicted ArsR family transcriptional regulator
VHLHLQRLEAAGLVRGHRELSEEGRALKLFELVPFALELTPAVVAEAARTLSFREERS